MISWQSHSIVEAGDLGLDPVLTFDATREHIAADPSVGERGGWAVTAKLAGAQYAGTELRLDRLVANMGAAWVARVEASQVESILADLASDDPAADEADARWGDPEREAA